MGTYYGRSYKATHSAGGGGNWGWWVLLFAGAFFGLCLLAAAYLLG